MAQLVKNPPEMRKTLVQSLRWEDPLEEEMLLTPVFWPGEFHGLYSTWGHEESETTERLSFIHSFIHGLLRIIVELHVTSGLDIEVGK